MSGFFLMLLIVIGLFAMLCLSTYLRQPPRRRPRLLPEPRKEVRYPAIEAALGALLCAGCMWAF
jgi:hypothetical protein